MKIRMLVDGHTVQEYDLDFGKRILTMERNKGNLVVDDETRQLAKIEMLTNDSAVTVYPAVTGG
jgi:hypothetical protein